MTDQAQRLLGHMTNGRHSGSITQEHPILSRVLALQLGFEGREREVRTCVHELRMLGYPIASGDGGYWYAQGEEILPTIKVMLSKARETRKPALALMRELELQHQLALSSEFEL